MRGVLYRLSKVICPEGLKQKRPHLYHIFINLVHCLNRDARLLNDEEKSEGDKSSLFWNGLEEINETLGYLRQATSEYETLRLEITKAGPPKRPDPDNTGGGTPIQVQKPLGGLLSNVA
jgi:hypothetical protein